jgi:hypothetical protein
VHLLAEAGSSSQTKPERDKDGSSLHFALICLFVFFLLFLTVTR